MKLSSKVSTLVGIGLLGTGFFIANLANGVRLVPPASAQTAAPNTAAVFKNYSDMAQAVYEDTLAGGKALQKAVGDMLAQPSAATLDAARKAWVAARTPYLQSEAFRFTSPIIDAWEGKVNSWPLDEGFIDYVAAKNPDSENPLFTANIIANKALKINGADVDVSKITKELLTDKLHEAAGLRSNVAIGYHAIEFLLWGQDLNGTGPGAGNRPATDYDLKACTNGNCDRRADYLKVVTELLVDDLTYMVAQWKADGDARKRMQTLPANEAIVAVFSGLASLSYGELAGERMKLALLLHDPEEEQDCFSDNTHNSHYYDAIGIQNVYLGRYKRTDGSMVQGPSVSDIVKARAPAADSDVQAAIANTVSRMKVIVDKAAQGQAFDQLIAEGNKEGNAIVQAGIDGLLAQTAAFKRAVTALDLKDLKVMDSDSLKNPSAVKKRN